ADAALAEAARRQIEKLPFQSTRLLNANSHIVGMLGELAFAEWLGADVDLTHRLMGDAGRDFEVAIDGQAHLVDVKTDTYNGPGVLMLKVPVGEVRSDIYVLVQVSHRLCGWAWQDEVLAATKRRFRDHGILNHVLAEQSLHPMHELLDLIAHGKMLR
ncbi:MAG: hypothetical protein JXA74_02325, partial [Anaerolineae bacterium]|nr:hypothetical protein [Anaerolineae bacterium]